MNKQLEFLLNTGDIIKKRTLKFVIDEEIVAYTTEYTMHTKLGPFVWYITWKSDNCNDPKKLEWASIMIHMARARMYFPAYLDTRIPPANRESKQLKEILARFGMTEYDKFTLITRSHGFSPIKPGLVYEVEPMDCQIEEIHAIEEIVKEYNKELY